MLSVVLIKGKGLASADENGLSDPFCKIFVGSKMVKSKVVYKTLNPMWQQSFFLPFPDDVKELRVECWDTDDDDGSEDFLGSFTVPRSEFEGKSKYTQWYKLKADAKIKCPPGVTPSGEVGLSLTHKPGGSGGGGGSRTTLKKATARAKKSSNLPTLDEAAKKKARGRWGKLRTALMAKNLFLSKMSASDLYDEVKVAKRGAANANSASVQKLKALESQCASKGEKWTDPDFPPDNSSLYRSGSGGGGATITGWKRLSELHPNPKLFMDGVEAGDVMQGALGDCWFLGPLSVIADREKLFYNLFINTELSKYGVYGMRFFQDGEWVDVFVDDWIPVTYGDKPVYAKGPSMEEIWVPLIEKAYAKLHQSYEALISGSEGTAFLDLTGQPPQESKLDGKSPDEVFKMIKDATDEGHLLGCSCSDGSIEKENNGILSGHAYGILGYAESHGHKLIKCRNPWGKGEWQGDWSDNSSKWTPKMKAELDVVDADDGIFWMCAKDFCAYYNRLFVLFVVPPGWTKITEANHWSRRGNTAGGSTNMQFWRFNPQFHLSVPSDAKVSFLLTQTNRRAKGSMFPQIGLYVAKATCGDFKKLDMPKSDVKHGHEFIGSREYQMELDLEKGEYIVMACTYNPGTEAAFTLTAYSEAQVTLRRCKNWIKTSCNGRWASGSAGGCSNNKTWDTNPQFQLSLQRSGKVVVNVGVLNTTKKPHLGFMLFRDQGAKVSTAFEQIYTANFIDADVSGEVDLQAGKYIIVPSTFEPHEHYDFQITVYSQSPALLGAYGSIDGKSFPAMPRLGSNTPKLDRRGGVAALSESDVQRLKVEANAEIEKIVGYVQVVRKRVATVNDPKEIVPMAKALVLMRPKFASLREAVPGDVKKAAEKPKSNEKVAALKQTITEVLTDMFYVLIAVRTFLSTDEAVGKKVENMQKIIKQLSMELRKMAA